MTQNSAASGAAARSGIGMLASTCSIARAKEDEGGPAKKKSPALPCCRLRQLA